ncbi:MAG: hypothetical protein ACI4EU_02775 [Butyrivibrio sp.]
MWGYSVSPALAKIRKNLDKIDDYDVRPAVVKQLIKDLPKKFKVIVHDERK